MIRLMFQCDGDVAWYRCGAAAEVKVPDDLSVSLESLKPAWLTCIDGRWLCRECARRAREVKDEVRRRLEEEAAC